MVNRGLNFTEQAEASIPIELRSDSVIGIVGSAGKGPVNEPTLVTNFVEAAAFGDWKSDGFTLPKYLNIMLSIFGCNIVVVNATNPTTDITAITNEAKTFGALNNVLSSLKPYISLVSLGNTIVGNKKFATNLITLPTGITAVTAVKNAAGTVTYATPADYTVSGSTITRVGGGSIPADAEVQITYTATLVNNTDFSWVSDTGVFTRITTGKIIAGATVQLNYSYVDPTKTTQSDVIGQVNGTTNEYEGALAFLAAQNKTGLKPKILIAPEFTESKVDAATANPVASALASLAKKLLGVAIVDLPNTSDQAALEYRDDFDDEHLKGVDPKCYVYNKQDQFELVCSSAILAAAMARTDKEIGFWASASNKPVSIIGKPARTIEYSRYDDSCRAELLTNAGITTIIKLGTGYRFWGNDTFSTSKASLKKINSVRVKYAIEESIESAMIEAIDKNITVGYASFVTNSVNEFLRGLLGLGAIAGGKCWIDSAINTPEKLAAGEIYFDYDYQETPLAEKINFRVFKNKKYLTSILGATV